MRVLPPPCPECLAEPPGLLADFDVPAGLAWHHYCGAGVWRRSNGQRPVLPDLPPGQHYEMDGPEPEPTRGLYGPELAAELAAARANRAALQRPARPPSTPQTGSWPPVAAILAVLARPAFLTCLAILLAILLASCA